ncbi:unnamed protein product, partial [Heterosigma akashiwo]
GPGGTPRPKSLPVLLASDTSCTGCGAVFQCADENNAGFVPPEKYEGVVARVAALRQPQEEEVAAAVTTPLAQPAEEEGGEEEGEGEEEEERVICQRCYKLMHYGQVDNELRPGWSDNAFLTPKRFQDLLSPIRTERCVVVYLTDLFDFSGSLLWNLNRIVGDNPVMLAVNKVDLLPKDLSRDRVITWIHNETKRLGFGIPRKHISLVSCKTGAGVDRVVRDMRYFARERGNADIYVIGSANVGKSTFINYLLQGGREGKPGGRGPGKNASRGKKVTTSPIPGTTLDFLKIDIGGTLLIDTPGLILPHQLTLSLDPKELKAVLPESQVEHVTLRVGEGKSVLMGGLAKLDMLEGKPFFFTFFVSNKVKLHQTSTEKSNEVLEKHMGTLVFPPFTEERYKTLNAETSTHDFVIEGVGWNKAAQDIHISGLGFIGVTGAGKCKVRITAPKNVMVLLRDALMPYDTRDSTSKFTGGRVVRKQKGKGGRRT